MKPSLRALLLTPCIFAFSALSAEGGEHDDLDPQFFDLPAEASSRAGAGDSWVTTHRGSDLPGFNDSDVSDVNTAIPTSRGWTAQMKKNGSDEPMMVVSVSGYVHIAAHLDTRADLGDSFFAGAIPVTGGNQEHFRMHARESRFRIKSRTDTDLGQFRTWIEGDFFGAAGNELYSHSSAFRLRHAWGEWDFQEDMTLGMGQWWSLFEAIGFLPRSLDFDSPQGEHFIRGPQIRLTYRMDDWVFYFGAMNPESALHDSTGTVFLAESLGTGGTADKMPDFNLGVQGRYEWATFRIMTVFRMLSIDPDQNGTGPGSTVVTGHANKFAWAIQALLRVQPMDELKLFFRYIFGQGAGRWLYGDALAGGTINAAGNAISVNDAMGLCVGGTYNISPEFQANFDFGWYCNDDTPVSALVTQETFTVQVNVFWKPVSNFDMGLEYKWACRKVRTGTDADNHRVQYGATWYF